MKRTGPKTSSKSLVPDANALAGIMLKPTSKILL